ncbi:hypothetical protein TWF106_006252 [Orbilia oligospora]|uniref:Uncharacterized protein n=1 Tax=Orbilia oligospora TaxID=2813651 RepID=A0A6G1MA47_ORBOL|nr:hypothetical protein TWF106_006252 [Orbilia oligospora]KAF3230812.1 hypothetical protein TWF191_008652 [Orbilia oligospora]KAF3250280.1 hypothetical protein TWF192_005302 [Orbilia oligospora]
MRSQRITFGSCDQNEAAVPLGTQYQIDAGVPGATEREINDTDMADASENTSAQEHKESEDDDDDEDDEAEEQNGQVVGHGGDDLMVIEDLGVAVKAIDLDGDNDMINLMEELFVGVGKQEEVRKEEKE